MSSSRLRRNLRRHDSRSVQYPRPLSLKRSRCHNHNDDTISVSLVQGRLRDGGETSPGLTTLAHVASMTTMISLKLADRILSDTRDRLQVEVKTEPPEQGPIKKEEEDDSPPMEFKRRRRNVNEIAASMTETRLHAMLSVWSDDMRFVFYSILKGENNFDQNALEPSQEAIEFVREYCKE